MEVREGSWKTMLGGKTRKAQVLGVMFAMGGKVGGIY